MNHLKLVENRRILVVDDTVSIHHDFRQILSPPGGDHRLDEAEAALFGSRETATAALSFELDFAIDGEEALSVVRTAMRYSRPFAAAFIDVRLGPGPDGIETTRRIWQVDPHLEVVLCTAYSDHSWNHIRRCLGFTDRLLILKKPFDSLEVRQLALALTMKWCLARKTEQEQANADRMIENLQRELRTAQAAAAHAGLGR